MRKSKALCFSVLLLREPVSHNLQLLQTRYPVVLLGRRSGKVEELFFAVHDFVGSPIINFTLTYFNFRFVSRPLLIHFSTHHFQDYLLILIAAIQKAYFQ